MVVTIYIISDVKPCENVNLILIATLKIYFLLCWLVIYYIVKDPNKQNYSQQHKGSYDQKHI